MIDPLEDLRMEDYEFNIGSRYPTWKTIVEKL
jgi:hypothetical protein